MAKPWVPLRYDGHAGRSPPLRNRNVFFFWFLFFLTPQKEKKPGYRTKPKSKEQPNPLGAEPLRHNVDN